MFVFDPPAPKPPTPRRNNHGGNRAGSGRQTKASQLSPVGHAWLEARLGPLDERPDWVRAFPLGELVAGAYLHCLLAGDFPMAMEFRRYTTRTDRDFLRDNLEALVPAGMALPAVPYVTDLI